MVQEVVINLVIIQHFSAGFKYDNGDEQILKVNIIGRKILPVQPVSYQTGNDDTYIQQKP
jgi:hypothetical protein